MKWLIKLTLLILLTGCSAQWHLGTAIKKDPLILEKDTLVVTDTLVVPPVVLRDTVTLKLHDTIVLTKEKLSLRIIKRRDTLIIEGKCASDTIIRTIEVPYDKIVYVERESLYDKAQRWSMYVIIVAAGITILRLTRRS